MKKLRICPSHLEIRMATMPEGKEFKAVKLSPKEAMAFCSSDYRTFEDLLAKYGANNQLNPGELYNGYAVVFYCWGRMEVVAMRGVIRRVDPKTPIACGDYHFAEVVRKGLAWECVYPLGEGRYGQGAFKYVWTFRDCTFARHIVWGKEHGWLGYENLDSEAVDKSLKYKIVAALQREEKIVELNNVENAILMNYLGEYSYYKTFFVEVK